MIQRLYKEEDHPDLARSLHNVGMFYGTNSKFGNIYIPK